MPTLVCVPIMVQDPESALVDAAAARDGDADLVEYRIDEYFSGADAEADGVVRLVAESPLPCIVTCRVAGEGGAYEGDETDRISLYERLGRGGGKGEVGGVRAQGGSPVLHPPKYLDVEFASYTRSANIRQKVGLAVGIPDHGQGRESRASLILSTHDMDTRPADLMRRFEAMNGDGAAAVVKVAYRARSLRDALELLELPGQGQKPTIALGMGEFGLISRVLAPKFGGFLTFAALRPAAATAPGQPTVRELLEKYRFRGINSKTAVYGIVGWPVSHSLSPLVHNAGFEEAGHNGVYVPLPIVGGGSDHASAEPEAGQPQDSELAYLSLKATLLELLHHPRLDLRGVSITAPHKEGVVRLGKEHGWGIDPVAAAIGAANTLVVGPRGGSPGGALPDLEVRLFNTDAPAAAECLIAALGSLEGKRVGVVGAGGAGRAIAFGAVERGATVVIYSRELEKAAAVVKELEMALPEAKLVAAETGLLPKACCDALVNCTPIGMKEGPSPNALPMPIEEMTCDGTVIMDTVYAPLETPLLKAAKAAGFRTLDGTGLFIRQAERQFALWTGKPPPAGLYERLVRESISAG